MLKLRRDKPSQAAGTAGGRRGAADDDDARKVASLLPARNAPEAFVSPAGNELYGKGPFPTDDGVSSTNHAEDGKRDELSFERERVEAFHRLVANEPWRPHQPKRQRTSAENDWFLVQ
jgi:hypothetical protein